MALAGTTLVYEIGPFRLDPANGVLMRLGAAEPLGRRAINVLTALVRNARNPMTKDAIIGEAWPRLVVEEQNVSVQISSIRRVLAQTAGGDRWIETLSGRGYRFIGPVVEIRDGVRDKAGADRAGNLRAPLASFVGRERELVELKRLLARNRLVTLIGTGGIGKTRLAVQLAAEVSDAYPDGAWFVDLAPLSEPELVADSAAQALTVQQSHGMSLVDALCRHLKGRQLLLVVDNCEHVVEAAAAMVEAVLRGAPEPTIVATSREPLRVPGEQIYRLPPLSLPGSDGTFESIRKSEAVQLFVDRAQHQQHDFALTVEGAAGVAELCVRLDGLPLALELAAAHVHTLAIDEINARLDDRFRLLTAGSRSALPRQKTLQGTLDWSFGLLSELERVVLRRIAVFSGAFTADAAAQVAGDATLDAMTLAPTVAQLALRSLVVADSSMAPACYRLLETTRTYALERLAEAGENESVRTSHSRWIRSLFDNATDEWMRDGESQWRDRYAAHVDDLRAALEWSMGRFGDAADAIAIAGSSGPIWSTLGRFVEGARWLERASVHVDPRAPSRDGANVWLWLGVASEASPEAALDAFDRSLGAFCAINDAEGSCHAQIRRARALAALGKFDAAHEALADAAPALRHVAPPKLHAFYFSNSAFLANMCGDTDRAGEHYRQALVHYREAHHEYGELVTLDNIAEVNWSCGALEDAANAFRESVELRRTSRASRRVTLAFSLANLAGVLTELGHLDEALACEREAVPNLLDEERAWIFIDHFALRAALAGKLENAARIAGYASHAREVKKWTREPNEARACARLHALLREQLPAADVEWLLADGANLSAHDACRLALEE